MIEMRNQGHKIELGYVLAKAHWGKEYVPEAIKPLIEWAFKQKNVFRVWAICDTDNKASVRVLEKVGMKYEGLLRREIIHPNISSKPRDSYCYAITRLSGRGHR